MVGRYSEGLRKAKIMKQIYGRLTEGCRKVFGVTGRYSEISGKDFENVEGSNKTSQTNFNR
jgi:hypothetical protein